MPRHPTAACRSVRTPWTGRRGTAISSTFGASSPSASSSIARTSASPSPGRVRMSTCRSTRSGITLILVPPWAIVGANVVWVQAWNWRAIPTGSVVAARPSKASGSSSGADQLVGVVHALEELPPDVVDLGARVRTSAGAARPPPPSRARCRSCRAATRGPACPHPQLRPVAALLGHDHRELQPGGARDRDAAGLGDHVVGADGIGLVLDEVARPERARAPPRRRRRGRPACPWAGSRCGPGASWPRPSTRSG